MTNTTQTAAQHKLSDHLATLPGAQRRKAQVGSFLRFCDKLDRAIGEVVEIFSEES